MQGKWLPISDIPVQGREFYFEDDQGWTSIWKEAGLECRSSGQLSGTLGVFPQKHGVYFQGSITGQIAMPCTRCLEYGPVELDHRFDLFEEFEDAMNDPEGPGLIKFDNGQWMFSLERVLLEQFILTLPDKPLCQEDCSGLCPACGEIIGHGSCRCSKQGADPRMAVFRGLKIK